MEPALQDESKKIINPKDKSNYKQTTLDSYFSKKSTAKPQEKAQVDTSKNEECKVDRTNQGTADSQTSNKNLEPKFITKSEESKTEPESNIKDNSKKSESENITNSNLKSNEVPSKSYILPHKSTEWPFIKSKLELFSKGAADRDTFYSILDQFVNIHNKTKDEKHNFNLLKKAISCFSGFFEKILPFMGNLALKVETLFPEDISMLCQCENKLVFLNKKQSACLLFHMFFCTTINQENKLLPRSCTLIEWYNSSSSDEAPKDSAKTAKLECFLNYAQRIKNNLPELETISIERVSLDPNKEYDMEYWSNSSEILCEVAIKEGSIAEAKGAFQIDFANKFLGGGVLTTGCVQEEIMFAVAPEHICGCLLTECLLPKESVIIKGAQTYSRYSGYGETFKFEGDLEDQNTPLDEFGRRDIITVAIDAINFRTIDSNQQFLFENILRETNKAYVGFRGPILDKTAERESKKEVATGRWGCGAFRGDPQLKFVIQWLACSKVQRRMLFYPFEDKSLALASVVLKKYTGKTIRELFHSILNFLKDVEGEKKLKLFDYLLTDEATL